jgi:hypothetical protein
MRITDTDTNAVFQINASSTTGGVELQADATNVGSNPFMAFDVGGSEAMRILDGGNVGIGTSSPSESLTNRGNIFIETNSTSADSGNGLFWQSTTSGWTTSTAHAAIYGKRTDGSNGYLRFDTRQSGTTQEAMRIDSSGNLLHGKTVQSIGTVGVTLVNGQITATADGADAIRLNRKSSDGSIIDLRKDGTTVGSIGSEGSGSRLYIVQGDTGLGMQGDVDSIIPVSANGLSRGSAIDLGYSSIPFQDLYLSGNAYADNFIGTNDTNTFIAMTGSDLMRFYTGNTERMRITSGGKVLLNTTSTSYGGQIVARQSDGVSLAAVAAINTATSGTRRLIDFFTGTSTTRKGSIESDGTNTSYNTSSDYRLKENVTADWDATTRLKQLNPVRFNFIENADKTVDGFLAHEVQDIVPEAITGTKDAMMDEEYEVSAATGDIYTPAIEAVLDEDGNEVTPAVAEVIHSTDVERPEELAEGQQWRETTEAVMGTRSVPDYQGIDQSKLVPILTKALIEAVEKIEQLETRILALEAN